MDLTPSYTSESASLRHMPQLPNVMPRPYPTHYYCCICWGRTCFWCSSRDLASPKVFKCPVGTVCVTVCVVRKPAPFARGIIIESGVRFRRFVGRGVNQWSFLVCVNGKASSAVPCKRSCSTDGLLCANQRPCVRQAREKR